MDGLSAMKIWHMRCNSGGMFGSHKGKRWAVKFGRKGMADVLALPRICEEGHLNCTVGDQRPYCKPTPTWIEVKRPGEKQTADQEIFEAEVTQEGHRYFVVHSWEEVVEALGL